MLQVVLDKPEKLVFQETDIPKPEKDEVLIKIKRVGICGSDIHAYYGKHPTVFLPVIQGHEFAGEVVETGGDVDAFKKGQKVTVRPQYTCGACYHCQNGHENVCHNLKVIGCQVPGGAQEYLCVNKHLVIAMPEAMSYDDGAMIEPVAVGVACVRSFSESVDGKNILVLGAGTIGNLVAQSAKAFGAASVTITDVCDEKLEVAKQCGIDHAVNTLRDDLNSKIEEFYGKDGLDGALECVGIEATINDAIKVCRKGTEIIIVGVYGQRPAIDMINVQEKELKLIGTLMYSEQEFLEAMHLIDQGKINLEPLKSAHFTLKEYDKAYKYIENHKETAMKVIIDAAE